MPQSVNKRMLITQTNPKSHVSEAYRTLRTNIQYSMVDKEIQTIMVTSAGPGEGKSTTAANLAITYAQADQKVLLIDADLRKPTVHHSFMRTNRKGLTDVLTQQAELYDVVQETHIANLKVITSGQIPPNPSEILSSKRMTQMLDELKHQYDVVVLDTPPTIAVTDSQVVATKCDGVLLVIDAGKVKKDVAVKAKAQLEHVKARILGVVLNNVDAKNKDGYYYYYYGRQK